MRLLGAVLLATVSPAAIAEDLVIPPDELVYCTTCHGVQLMGNDVLGAPRLSGLDAWYVENQLRAFRDGLRGRHEEDVMGREMQAMAVALSDRQIRAAAEYVTKTRSVKPVRTQAGDPNDGAFFYFTCSTCHGPEGAGDAVTGGPPLTGLNDWYMIEQLRKFRTGLRGTHPDDTFGRQMKAATDILPDDRAIFDVVAYISTLTTEREQE